MSNLYCICQHVKIFKGSEVYAEWQNFFTEGTVDGLEFQPFSVSTIQVNRSADEGGVTIEAPSTFRILTQFESAVNDQHLVQVKLLKQSGTVTGQSFQNFHAIAIFTGVALTFTNNLTQARLAVGSAMDAISGDVPGRKISSALVGMLPQI